MSTAGNLASLRFLRQLDGGAKWNKRDVPALIEHAKRSSTPHPEVVEWLENAGTDLPQPLPGKAASRADATHPYDNGDHAATALAYKSVVGGFASSILGDAEKNTAPRRSSVHSPRKSLRDPSSLAYTVSLLSPDDPDEHEPADTKEAQR